MPTYTVLESTATGDWKNEYGNFRTYRLKLDGQELPAELNQKIDSPPPTAGASLDLDLQPHPKFGGVLKAKKVQAQGGGRDPRDSKRIAVQASHKVAVDILRLAAEVGAWDKPASVGEIVGQVKTITNVLVAQVEEAGA